MNNIVPFQRSVQFALVRVVYFMKNWEVRRTTPLPLYKAHRAIDMYERHIPVASVEIEEVEDYF